MSYVKKCKNFTGEFFFGDDSVGDKSFPWEQEIGPAIKKCTGWTLSPKPRIIGQGAFGSVIKGELRKTQAFITRKRPVAIKIQKMRKEALASFEKESTYGWKLGELELGPKIYNTFYYTLTNKGVDSKSIRTITIMEPFKYSGGQAMVSPFTIAQSNEVFRQMLLIIHRVTASGIFCRDIKPGNFVVNIIKGNVVVRMIDFGVPFCSDEIPHFLSHINATFEGEEQPSMRRMAAETLAKGDKYPRKIYAKTMQISLILQLFKAFMKMKKRKVFTKAKVKALMAPAIGIIREVCGSDTELRNISEAIINTPELYHIFLWYLYGGNDDKAKATAPQMYRREIVLEEFHKLCSIDAFLQGRRMTVPKKGMMTRLKQTMRLGTAVPNPAPPPPPPAAAAANFPPDIWSGGKKRKPWRKSRKRRRKSRKRRRKSRKRRRKTRKRRRKSRKKTPKSKKKN
jgi:hypothetical protein